MLRQFITTTGMVALAIVTLSHLADAQGPTIDTGGAGSPGGITSSLGPLPGSNVNSLGSQPGGGTSLLSAPPSGGPISGRAGASATRVLSGSNSPENQPGR
jgi:hypothetical protein